MAFRHALVAAVATVLLAVLIVVPAGARTGGAGPGGQAGAAHRPRDARDPQLRLDPQARASSRGHGRLVALHGRAMWIWELPDTARGSLPRLIAAAHQHRITTLIIKSSDGLSAWPQFNAALVARLHAAHLRVCAWQYVYGVLPGEEANLGADAVRDGADCLIIDAEVQYQGRYVAAQKYVGDLRRQIGAHYPVALAGLPYVDYHPAFPYSVFLGPDGAQYDVPQMYWRDIGTSVDAVFAHTYAFNRPYRRAIYPLGQVYGNPPTRQIVRFRQVATAYGAGGVSWWDWQDAGAAGWRALSAPTRPLSGRARAVATTPMAAVGEGARGDLVVWLQEHLVSAGEPIEISGDFGYHTRLAVQAFQTAHRLSADGIVGPLTWGALLRYHPLAVRWVHHGRRIVADAIVAAAAGGRRGDGPLSLPVPASASLPARRDEIPAGLGAGGAGGAGGLR